MIIMATINSSIFLSRMKGLKSIIKNTSVKTAGRFQDIMGAIASAGLRGKVTFTEEVFENFTAVNAIPEGIEDEGYGMLFLHGGGYTAGSLSYAKGFGGHLAEFFGMRVMAPAYRLAPEHPFPAALLDAYESYLRLTEELDPKKVFLFGESAGGGLCFALLNMLREEGREMPLGCLTSSPWTDLTLSGETYVTNLESDPTISMDFLRECVRLYCGDTPPSDGRISPLFADTDSFPPVFITVGTTELLLSDSKRMAEKLNENGIDITYREYKGMWHVFISFPIPEAKEALIEMKSFTEHCKAKHSAVIQDGE